MYSSTVVGYSIATPTTSPAGTGRGRAWPGVSNGHGRGPSAALSVELESVRVVEGRVEALRIEF